MTSATINRTHDAARIYKFGIGIFVVASGYFDPLHVGHIEYLELAKQQGNCLIVIVNNDKQIKLKKEVPFMSEMDRMRIVGSLRCVDMVFLSIDKDLTVNKSIEHLVQQGGITIFAKGGDRNLENIPEKEICEKHNIKIVDGLGEKIRSSSDFIKNIGKK
jgi:cytidyltransferase-like protein